MTAETLQARSCPWCHSIGIPLNGCKNIWHSENLADLREARRVPIHEKVFATAGNVDYASMPERLTADDWASMSSLDERYTTVDADRLEMLCAQHEELGQENHVLRAQIGKLNNQLSKANSTVASLSVDLIAAAEVNEGLRLQIEHLNAELAKALNVPPTQVQPRHGWTSHGHACCRDGQIGAPRPSAIARCGGPALCQECAREAAVAHERG